MLHACFVCTLSLYVNSICKFRLTAGLREQAFDVPQSWPGILKFSQTGSLGVHEARLLWRGNLTRKRSYAVILLVRKDFRFLCTCFPRVIKMSVHL